MKRAGVILLVFLLGVFAGAAFMRIKARRDQHRTFEMNIARWKQSVPHITPAFYTPVRRVPLPRGLNFSTNTWQQLSFWNSFARAYQTLTSNDLNRRPMLTTVAFPFGDQDWIEEMDRGAASDFAEMALRKSQSGMSDEELVDWVTENYRSIDWLHYEENQSAFFRKLADGIK